MKPASREGRQAIGATATTDTIQSGKAGRGAICFIMDRLTGKNIPSRATRTNAPRKTGREMRDIAAKNRKSTGVIESNATETDDDARSKAINARPLTPYLKDKIVNPLLLGLFYQSVLGQKVKKDAHASIDSREEELLTRSRLLTETRDKKLEAMQLELTTREASHVKIQAAREEAEEKFLASHYRTVVSLPAEMDQARRSHDQAQVPIRDELRAIAKARADLNEAT
jgi:hypothetical protein